MTRTLVGLEVLAENPQRSAAWGRCAYLCNQASVTYDYVHGHRLMEELLGERLIALFAPQHGLWGTAQDNMIESPHTYIGASRTPVYSLYSETREPNAKMLEKLDTIIVDLQTVGCRIYTFKSTIAACLRAAKLYNKRVVVLDRPNPLGGVHLEGRCIDEDTKSFVGEFVMPMRHGLTAGEAALFFNSSIGADLELVAMQGWDAQRDFRYTERPWVITSPNLPSLDPVFVYPGTVIFEGCNLSEGRGTGLPFQFIGAPYISDEAAFKRRVEELSLHTDGVFLRPCRFEPTSGKWSGQSCQGVQIHVTAPEKIASYQLALSMLAAAREQGGSRFNWKEPPYEYEYETLPMKIILGSMDCIKHIEAFDARDEFWSEGLSAYRDEVSPHLQYERRLEILR